jgi:Cu(I)/Ag(I) efflux system periplasmic protein CusF
MQRVIAAATIAAILLPPAALAVEAHHQPAADQAAKATNAMVDGEVRKVDKDAKKITIKHGPISNLGMPPMTMVFQVTDAAMLDQVKAGDKVRFSADKVGSAYTVTKIEPAK